MLAIMVLERKQAMDHDIVLYTLCAGFVILAQVEQYELYTALYVMVDDK